MTNLHRIMSFNINATTGYGEGDNSWTARAPLAVSIINRYKADLIGLQEMLPANFETLRPQLEQYTFIDGNCYGDTPPDAYNTILYRTDRYELLDDGEIWYSDTPDVESSGWGVEYPMGATWAKLKCLHTGDELVYLNTHFEDDDGGKESRKKASQLICNRLDQLAPDLPVVVTGDFNCNPWWPPYQTFMEHGYTDTYRAAGHADSTTSNSIHFYMGDEWFSLAHGDDMFWRVDWILTRDGAKRVQTVSSQIIKDAEPPIYPSDHYPVVSEVRII